MTKTWGANPYTMERLYLSLDDEFKAQLESNGCSLFRLLKLPSSCILGPVVDILLSYYDSTQNVFIFGCHRLRITLEDVLFITGLPISGKPVIGSTSRGTDAFRRIFGCCPHSGSLSMSNLMFCAKNKMVDYDKRMIAVLLYVIYCFVIPATSECSRQVKTTYVELLENLAEVDSYAWGAALLAFLYTGINKWKDDAYNGRTVSSTFGNAWLLLCFFFIRIPNLMSAVGDVENDIPQQESLVNRIVENVRIISKEPKYNYKENVVNILNNLSDEDIRWLPYDSSWLPPRLQDQYRFRALVAPLFCNNYVVHHRPQLVPKQFGLTEGSVSGVESYDYEIKIQGPDNPDYLTLYKKEIELWEVGKQLQDFISGKRPADVAEASSSPPSKKSKLDVLHEEIARELAEKLGTLTARLSKKENEDKIRLLESKIKNSEAREEKLSSELRAARERIESWEAREKKLMSEVRVTLERNVELEGEIKSSEAREKKLKSEAGVALERNVKLHKSSEKLNSELNAARERNVKLEGEITSLEDREKKLKSEVRAAVERNEILQGEIESSEAGQKKLMSEVRVVLESYVKLKDKIKNSEKLKSEVRVARERNAKLEGEIKSAESREEKLKSEVRAAAERNEKIKHAVSSLANLVNH